MPDAPARLQRAVDLVDAANAADPNEVEVRGRRGPKELLHAELVTEWVRRLCPEASEALLLAARAHHIRRWEVPRSTHPDGRAGYLRWRRDLHERHAEDLGRIMEEVGYDPATVARAGAIVRKRGLAGDVEVQALEDAMCLVFVEVQLADLAARLDRVKMVDVVRKTLAKMTSAGRQLALGIPVGDAERAIVEEALA